MAGAIRRTAARTTTTTQSSTIGADTPPRSRGTASLTWPWRCRSRRGPPRGAPSPRPCFSSAWRCASGPSSAWVRGNCTPHALPLRMQPPDGQCAAALALPAACLLAHAGYRWLVAFYRLVIYAVLLLPGFIQVRKRAATPHAEAGRRRGVCSSARGVCALPPRPQVILFYCLSSRVIRSIPYGRGVRHSTHSTRRPSPHSGAGNSEAPSRTLAPPPATASHSRLARCAAFVSWTDAAAAAPGPVPARGAPHGLQGAARAALPRCHLRHRRRLDHWLQGASSPPAAPALTPAASQSSAALGPQAPPAPAAACGPL